MTELDQTLKTAVIRLLELREQRQAIDSEETALKTVVRAHLTLGEQGTVNGQPVVALQPNRRFSPDLAAKTLPAELLALCSTTKPDSALAKKTLPPALYDSCLDTVGEPKVALL